MLQEMTCRIAHGYKTAPDLRLTTLENLARQHQHESQNAEAAMCLIHSAALVAEYLFFKESGYGGPRGSQAFAKCTINCQEETIWTADVGLVCLMLSCYKDMLIYVVGRRGCLPKRCVLTPRAYSSARSCASALNKRATTRNHKRTV